MNGRVLLGANLHTASTINRHLFSLRLGQHRNAEWQHDWHEHGGASLTAEVLHVLERQEGRGDEAYRRDLTELERLWLDELRSYGDAGSYAPGP